MKYHPDITVAQNGGLAGRSGAARIGVPGWHASTPIPNCILPNAYAVEFLRHNLTPERIAWFRGELAAHGLRPDDHARLTQQRGATPFRFSAFEEKSLVGRPGRSYSTWFTLFSAPDDPIRKIAGGYHFDAYLPGRSQNGVHQPGLSLPNAGHLESEVFADAPIPRSYQS